MSRESQGLLKLGRDVKASWQRFLDAFEPLRPDLYRYCRHLTRSPWDAEDLAQEVLTRAFVTLGTLFSDLPEPRAWLFRVASNLWIDHARKIGREPRMNSESSHSVEPQATREAAGTLLMLAPRERVALILKDVFELSLEEIAGALETTTGAVKAALHRGRQRLAQEAETEAAGSPAPAPEVLNAFARAFNARDLGGLTALLLDTSRVEIVGLVTEYGPEAAQDPRTGSFAVSLGPLSFDERGGLSPTLLEGYLGGPPRCEVRRYRDQWLLLFWYDHREGPMVRSLMTVAIEDGGIAHVRNYFFAPEVLAEVCMELNLAHHANGYRYWPEAHRSEPNS